MGGKHWQDEHAEDDSKPGMNAVDKLRPPAIVRMSRTFLDNVLCCKRGRLLHILTELEKMTSRCRITILDLKNCGVRGQDAERHAAVLAQCPALNRLYLDGNQLEAEGALLPGVLPQCPVLSKLNLGGNQIGNEGAERLAGVVQQRRVLSILGLGGNQIGNQEQGGLQKCSRSAKRCLT